MGPLRVWGLSVGQRHCFPLRGGPVGRGVSASTRCARGLFTPNPPNGTHTYEGEVSRSVPSSSDCAPLRTPPGPLSPAAVPPASSSAALPVRLSCSRLSDAGSDLRRWYLGGVGRFWGAPRALHLPVRDTHCCSRSPKSSAWSCLCRRGRGSPTAPLSPTVSPVPGGPSVTAGLPGAARSRRSFSSSRRIPRQKMSPSTVLQRSAHHQG